MHTVCKNDSMCVETEGECVARCEAEDFVQAEDCWCATHTAVCEAGQVCEEEEEKCRDIVMCKDPRTSPEWEKMNLDGVGDHKEFIEDRNYTFTCADNFFIEDYVRIIKYFFGQPLFASG